MPTGESSTSTRSLTPLQNASGNREFIGAVTDITERKTAEEKIRTQEAELRQMLDFAPQLVGVLGPKRERLYANRVALAYLRRHSRRVASERAG